jgi:hypothetical protein
MESKWKKRSWPNLRYYFFARDFSCNLCVQTGSGAHPASCTKGTGGPFPGGKARPGVTLTTHPHLVPRSWMSRSYTSFPPYASIGVLWDCFTYTFAWRGWGKPQSGQPVAGPRFESGASWIRNRNVKRSTTTLGPISPNPPFFSWTFPMAKLKTV